MKRIAYYLCLISPFLILPLSLVIGPVAIPLEDIFRLFSGHYPSTFGLIVLNIRLPRILLAMEIGAALSVSGAVLQAIFQNPLVDTYILGIAAGGGFGATLAFLIGFSWQVAPFAFACALLAVVITCYLAKVKEAITPISLVLAGIIVNAFFSAGTSLFKIFLSHERLAEVIYWLMGSLSNADWRQVKFSLPLVILCLTLVFLMRWRLNVLSLNETMVNNKIKLAFIGLVSLMTAISVAVCGIVGWIGLIIPHLIRMGFGADHKRLIPLSATLGATMLVAADDLARSMTPYEIPLGLITALLGLPFFAYLLKKTGGGWNAQS